MKVYAVEFGSPEDIGQRKENEQRTYRVLSNLGIEYMRADHDPAATVDECADVDKALGVKMCKNLFLCNRQETDFYLLMMTGEKKFSSKDFAKKMGIARVSFAKEEYMNEYLDILPGAVSVLGLVNDINKKVKLVMDADIANSEYIGCHPCVNTSSLKINTKDILTKFLPLTEHEVTVIEL